jgi:hypothetical protein
MVFRSYVLIVTPVLFYWIHAPLHLGRDGVPRGADDGPWAAWLGAVVVLAGLVRPWPGRAGRSQPAGLVPDRPEPAT